MITYLQKLENHLWKKNNPKRLDRIMRTLISIFRIISQSKIKLLATSLTYTTLLAIVPLLAILFALLKSFSIDIILKKIIIKVLEPMGNAGHEVGKHLIDFINNAQTGFLGGIGIVFLFYSIFILFRKIEIALNNVWFVPNMRNIKNQILGYMGGLTLIVVISSVAIGLNLFFHKDLFVTILGNSSIVSILLSLLAKLLSILTTAISLAFTYISTINTRVNFFSALSGGLFCAILWVPLTWIFTSLVATSVNYSLIYSGFATLVIFLIWMNILWLLFLSGALLAYFIQYPSLLKSYSSKNLNPAEQEYFANKLLHIIINYFDLNKSIVKTNYLIKNTGLGQKQIQELLTPFLLKGVITNFGNDGYLLSMKKDKISNDFIKKTIRGNVRGVFNNEDYCNTKNF